MIGDALAPYASAIKAIAFAVAVTLIASVSFAGGCSVQKGREADARKALEQRNASQAQALRNAATALRASGDALDEVGRQAAAAAARADLESRELAKAGQVALDAQKTAEKRAAALAKQLDDVRRKPDCALLQDMDLEVVCKFKPR